MTSLDLIREIDAAAYRCWPAGETIEYDGWLLRFSDGFSRRGNSVYPRHKGTLNHGLKLGWCRRWYEDRNLELVVRQTPASEAGLDEVLAAAGFGEEGRTDVMWASLGREATRPASNIATKVSSAWLDAMASLWGIAPEQEAGWRAIIGRIDDPCGFALVFDDGQPIAAGLGVVGEQWLGLFEIVVADQWRRRGVGTDLTQALLDWGRQEGATRAFLQVVAGNRPAVALYEQLGFERAYTYWYRRAPAARVSDG